MPQARNAKTHPGRRVSAATADPLKRRVPSWAFPGLRQAPHTHNSGGPEKGPCRPGPPTLTPPARGGRAQLAWPAPLTRLLGAVAPHQHLVHLDAGPAALQHRQAPARAAHLARRLGSRGQRAAEARGAGEEQQRRAPRLRRRPGRGGRPGHLLRAAPRPPRSPLVHRRFPGSTAAPPPPGPSEEADVQRQRGRRREGNRRGLSRSVPGVAVRSRRADRGGVGNPPLLRRRSDAASLSPVWGRSRRSTEKRRWVFFLRGRNRKRNRKGN